MPLPWESKSSLNGLPMRAFRSMSGKEEKMVPAVRFALISPGRPGLRLSPAPTAGYQRRCAQVVSNWSPSRPPKAWS